MTRGRTPTSPAAPAEPNLDQERINGAAEAMRTDALAQQQEVAEGVFDLGRAVGAALMASMVKNFSAAAEVRAFEEINKSKSFKHLAIKMPDGIPRPAESIDEFCRVVFGRGYKAMADQKVLLERLGEETYESANRLGLNRGQLRLLVSLPEEDRALVEDAMRSESKPDVIAAIQALASKLDEVHAKVDELKAEEKAKEELLADKNKLLDAERAKVKRIQALPKDEAAAELLSEAADHFNETLACLAGQLRAAFIAVTDHHATAGGDSTQVLAGYVGRLQQELVALREEFNLPDTFGDGTPEWMRATADDQDLAGA